MRKVLKIILIFIIMNLILVFTNKVFCEDELKLKSNSAVVIEKDSGRILYSKKCDEKNSIASLTKIMTAIMLKSNCKNDEKITVPKSVVNVGGSLANLKKDSIIEANDLLYAMLLPSGNDAAYTIGYYIGNSSINNYASIMTKKAKEIGAVNTSFANPHGLDNDNHYSTARDVALITRYALNFFDIDKAIGTKSKTVNIGFSLKTYNNTNSLLNSYDACDGGKTGYTADASRCLMATATKNDMRLIAVVLGADTTNIRFNETREILEYSFTNYKLTDVSNYLKVYIKIPIKKSIDSYYEEKIEFNAKIPLKEGEYEKIYTKYDMIKNIDAPMAKNTKIGTVKLCIEDEVIYSQDVYLNKNIYKIKFEDYAIKILREMFNQKDSL